MVPSLYCKLIIASYCESMYVATMYSYCTRCPAMYVHASEESTSVAMLTILSQQDVGIILMH